MTYVFSLAAALVLANIAASVVVLRTSAFYTAQRVLQLGLIWLVPVAGDAICISFAKSQAANQSSKSNFNPLYSPSDGGGPDGPGLCGCGGDSGGGASD